jgi:glucose/arabinose dehydrogenase
MSSFVSSVEPLEARQLLAFSASINFQPPTAPVPAGYVADKGTTYHDQGNGLTYGWDVANTAYRDRNNSASPDQRYDTLSHTQLYGNRTWALKVPNGAYTVHLVAGDPSASGSTIRYNLEGALALSGSTTSSRRWVESTTTVTVKDGALTLTNGAGANNNKVCFIDVRAATTTTNAPPRTPVITEPATDGETISGADVHMVTAPFSDPNPGDTHYASDWEIRRASNDELVWKATGVRDSAGKVHIHLGDGQFVNSLAGKHELPPSTDFKVRVRHLDSSGASNRASAWAVRRFHTASAITPLPNSPDWTADQAGYKVEKLPLKFPSGESKLRLVVNIAFVPEGVRGHDPGDPLLYATELYGKVRVVTNDYTVHTYASGLLNYNPSGAFPGPGEQGLSGLAIDPASGDVFVSMLYDDNPSDAVANRWPKVTRLHSTDGGITASTRADILKMPGEQQGQSHQVSNLSIGPDGKLYVHNGDGLGTPQTALNLSSFRGKVLRMNLNGTPATDNPFYNASDGISAKDYVFAYGLRNPFGGAWRASDGAHYEVENGPGTDRLAKVRRGVSYGWNGNNSTMSTNAIYNWNPAVGPVNLAFVQSSTFNGSGFPTEKLDHAFVAESGPTYATGPQSRGKRISEFVIGNSTTNGNLVSGPRTLVHYTGNGKGTAVALAAGPGGLFFSDFYVDDPAGGYDPTAAGSNILRVVYVGGTTS